MSNAPKLSRRMALAGAAALPLAAAGSGIARAAAPMMGSGMSPFNRLKLGSFEVTTLLAGTATRPEPQTIFGLNVDADTFNAVSAEARLPIDAAQFFFTPTLVNTGSELVLFDTGLNGEAMTAALAAAGYTPDQVDVVVLTHMHGDHIGGMTLEGGALTYPNARYVTGTAEYDHWAAAANEGFDAKVKPFAEQFTFLEDGGSVASGLTAMAAFGHTPGPHELHGGIGWQAACDRRRFRQPLRLVAGPSRLGSALRHGQTRRRRHPPPHPRHDRRGQAALHRLPHALARRSAMWKRQATASNTSRTATS